MLQNTTIEGLRKLRLPAMAQGVQEQREQPGYQELSFEDRLGLLVDKELCARDNRRLERLLKAAKLKLPAMVEDLDYQRPRGLVRREILELAECHWVTTHQSLLIVGPTGVGKTYLACARSRMRRSDAGTPRLYVRAPRLFDELSIARADGRLVRLMSSLARTEILVVDDFLIRSLSADQAADLLEVIEDRAQLRSTILASQLPVTNWHEALGDPTIADAVMDRLLEGANRVEITGDSMRRSDAPTAAKKPK